MPLAQLKPVTPDAPARAHPAGIAHGPVNSPARALQERLEASTGAGVAMLDDRWSPRRSLALIVSASFALWAAILFAGAQAVHALA